MRLSKPMKEMLMAASQERHHMLTGSARTQTALVERGLAILDRRHVRTGGFEFYALTSEGYTVARSLVDAATTAHVEAVVGNILAEDDETLTAMLDDLLTPVTVAEMIDNAKDEQATLIKASEDAQHEAECARITDMARSLTVPQGRAILNRAPWQRDAVTSMPYSLVTADTGTMAALTDRGLVTYEQGSHRLTSLGLDVKMELDHLGITLETLAEREQAEYDAAHADDPSDADLITLVGAWRDAEAIPTAFRFGCADVRVGDVAIMVSRGMWRRGLVTKVGPTNITMAYTTDGAVRHLQTGYQPTLTVTTKAQPRAQVATVPRGGQPTEVAPQPVTEPDAWQSGMDDLAGQPTEDDAELVTELVTDLAAYEAECARITDMARSCAAQGRAIMDYIDEDDAPVDILTLDTLADFLAGPNAPTFILPRTDAWTRGMAALWRKDNKRTPRSRRPRGRARVGAR